MSYYEWDDPFYSEDGPEPNCTDCGDTGWRGRGWCQTCNARGQLGKPEPVRVAGPIDPEPF